MIRMPHDPFSRERGFALLEAMLAVAIFALGILALGRCISQGLAVERLKGEDARASRILQNRAAEIEAGAIPTTEAQVKIDGVNGGIILTQTREALHKKDEHGAELANLFQVKLEAAWLSGSERPSRSLSFYVWSQQP
jgi:Tfp pilus assembly protein PilV